MFFHSIYPENWPDFGIAGHFVDGVVDIHGVLDHRAVFKHLDLLGYTGDGKVVAVAVKLDTGTQQMDVSGSSSTVDSTLLHVLHAPRDDAGAVVQVAGVRQGGQRPHRVVTGEFWQTLHEVVQLVQVPAVLWTHCNMIHHKVRGTRGSTAITI